MKLPRQHRILTALIALFGMLVMQLAVASYACPMPGCDQVDQTQPALCHAHCQDGKSSPDKAEAPVVAPAAVIVCAVPAPLEPLAPAGLPGAEPASFLQRSTAPPISIRHCCFRI
jgi:hypothetical protein